jgi:hypothetical protein
MQGLKSILERKEIGLENILSDMRGLKNAFEKKKIGLESALSIGEG